MKTKATRTTTSTGLHSTIPIRWDDKAETLTIGDRHGNFPGMLEHRSFRIMTVMNGRGTGISPSAEADATVEYDGKATSVHVRARP